MSSVDWEQQKFDQVFANVCEFLEYRERLKPDDFLDFVTNRLETLYVYQGQDWTGKGAAADITDAATIAAYETVRARLQQPQTSTT